MKTIGSHDLHTRYGCFVLYGFEKSYPTEVIVALKINARNQKKPWLIRIQYGCLTGTAFHSTDCDCARQLDYCMRRIASYGHGLIIYFPKREANGAGLAAKIRMNTKRGKPVTEREAAAGLVSAKTEAKKLKVVKPILRAVGVTGSIQLLTNSPRKILAFDQLGLPVQSIIHFQVDETALSKKGKKELKTKRDQLGHWKSR